MVVRMVLAVQKHLQITNMITLDNFDLKNFLKKSILGNVRAQVLQVPVGGSHGGSGWSWLSGKHLQITNIIILENFGFKNCLKNSISGDVRAQVLQVPVGGSHGDQDGPGCPETPSNDQYYHGCQLLLLQLSHKINPWGSPCPWPTP